MTADAAHAEGMVHEMGRTHAPEREVTRAPAIVLKGALVMIGAAGIAGWIALALFHIDDRYKVGHVAGHWMALAQYANEGTLYPPLSDGERFGGTRHMPLPILVNAGAARVTGEYLMAGKLAAMMLFGALLLLAIALLRQLRCPWPMALALAGLLPATNTGLLVGSTVGGDVLAVALQVSALLALTAAMRRDAPFAVLGAGILAGLAVASKLTGIWAALAAVTWLAGRHDWRRISWFTAAWAGCALLTLGLTQWASGGRFVDTFVTLTFAGTHGPVGWLRAPNQLIFFGSTNAMAVWTLASFAALAVIGGGRASGQPLHHHALGWALLLTLVVFTDVGAGFNQLLDLGILTLLAIGGFAARLPWRRFDTVSLTTILALAVVWAGATGVRALVPDLREAKAIAQHGERSARYNPRPLAHVVAPEDTLLAEDPGLPVLLGRTPTVLDAFMLRRLDEVDPSRLDALVARIDQGAFDHVVLIVPLHEDDFWWRDYHFGPRLVRALRDRYVLAAEVDGYYVYRPEPRH